ncbi:MAG: outer membrane beta-barrel protein [Pedobacter sp.]|nr:outer membrane beta-barrel protein [Pedobacter sp.]MDQ8053659.1 outer membrane beta-barrel protein [Pedobacter sp.]
MKSKILGLLALIVIAGKAHAQTEQGKNLLGGSASYTSSKKSTLKDYFNEKNDAQVGLSFGHFFWKNLSLGVKASYNSGTSKVTTDYLYNYNGGTFYMLVNAYTDTEYRYAAVGPFARYYIDLSGRFKIYSELAAAFGFGKQKNMFVAPQREYHSGHYKSRDFSLNAGAAIYPTKKLAIEIGFNLGSYSYATAEYGDTFERTKGFSFGLNNFKPILGIGYHF